MPDISNPPMLSVTDLRTYIYLKRGVVKAVDGVSFKLREGEAIGIVGESGSGKSMTCLSILRLVPQPAGRIVSGKIILDGVDILELDEQEMTSQYRGRRISMISQDPLTSLNPVFSIGDQVGGPFRYHGIKKDRRGIKEAVVDVLGRVRIPAPSQRLKEYPHQFSGGMRQRVVAAMAIACGPRLLIADEPTSALDVTIQIQMLQLLQDIQQEAGVGLILITHDLGVAAYLCQRIAVMYAGRIVEVSDVRTIYKNPSHPYTQALLNSVPRLGEKKKRLFSIEGQPPDLLNPPSGCAFWPRCARKLDICRQEYPQQTPIEGEGFVCCWQYE
jgi:oligopeptide/dipeptide ABC transporter ATP-binding protein